MNGNAKSGFKSVEDFTDLLQIYIVYLFLGLVSLQ
jgi:hypothetical protein